MPYLVQFAVISDSPVASSNLVTLPPRTSSSTVTTYTHYSPLTMASASALASAYKLSDIHSSSLPLLEFVRDVGDAFQQRREVPLRIVSILAGSTTGEISTESLQEIVKMLQGHTDLIERCSIFITGKIQVLTSDDGSLKVVCSSSDDDGEPHTLWIGTEGDAANGDTEATQGRKQRMRQSRKKRLSPLPKKNDTAFPFLLLHCGERDRKSTRLNSSHVD